MFANTPPNLAPAPHHTNKKAAVIDVQLGPTTQHGPLLASAAKRSFRAQYGWYSGERDQFLLITELHNQRYHMGVKLFLSEVLGLGGG